ncbi:MAG: transglutaminase family protein [Spirulinaceae cyanobacterium SM2_1_0]|nr:transglutaminase family protein [Spirulinaceae cyanobacterium SM2_1_0]
MLFQIQHTLTYHYSQPVTLKPQILRLRPRTDGQQTLRAFQLQLDPEPLQVADLTDLDGNAIAQLTFAQPTERLKIQVNSTVETHCTNPFNYQFDPWGLHLPPDYPSELQSQLQPYLTVPALATDGSTTQLAQSLYQATDGNTSAFLNALNQRLYTDCQSIIRETGEPWPPDLTWREKRGSCRDLAVLYMAACRSVRLATRFVSGYQEGDPDQDNRDLHAWVEVYVPGGGWRGFDPTHGLAVSDRHIALAASAIPRYAAPTPGGFVPLQSREPVRSHIETDIQLRAIAPNSP